ncbi:MAG: hypothetical protein WBI36_06500, partial [Erysipelotrichaceae bacterium]
GHNRPIMKIVADISPGLELAAGTYWLAFSLNGSLIGGSWGIPNILEIIIPKLIQFNYPKNYCA